MYKLPLTEDGGIDLRRCALGIWAAARNGDLAIAETTIPQLEYELRAIEAFTIERCAKHLERVSKKSSTMPHERDILCEATMLLRQLKGGNDGKAD